MNLFFRMENAPNLARPGNYWGWLENITPGEVRRQIREMIRGGQGGCVMHARGGLEIPYLGSAWMDAASAMIDEGLKHDFLTIVDDEHGWPSGFGAGKVTALGLDYWKKHLCMEQGHAARLNALQDNTLALYRLQDQNAVRIVSPESVPDDELIRIGYIADRHYVDNMNPNVVKAFIRESYEPYADRFQASFGKGLFAIFTDEPQLTIHHCSWSFVLPDAYREAHGRDILDDLPLLFLPLFGHEEVRYRYWKTVNRLFVQNYAGQINAWCHDHGILFTGHTLAEDTLQYMVSASGGTMTFYENMSMPGMDWLWRVPVTILAPKQLASVGAQLGKVKTLSEIYGAAGWAITPSEMRWIADAHMVLGVQYMLQHLGLYSLKGSRKREYPASIHYQQPYWEVFKAYSDYTAALSVLVSETVPVIDTLLIHPLHTAWMLYDGDGAHDAVKALDHSLDQLMQNLLHRGVDFHLGDEDILEQHALVHDGALHVGLCQYHTVILPECITLEHSTLRLLEACLDAGIPVYTIGTPPSRLSAVPSDALSSLMRGLPNFHASPMGIQALAERMVLPFHWHVQSGEGLLGSTRDSDEGRFHLLFNPSHDQNATLMLDNPEGLVRYDVEKHAFESLPTPIVLPAMATVVLFRPVQPLEEVLPVGLGLASEPKGTHINLTGPWHIDESTPNALPMDRCAYRLDGGMWETETDILMLQQQLIAGGTNHRVTMKYTFESEFAPKGPLWLVIEEPERCTVLVNGKKPGEDAGWWVDTALRKLPVDGLIRHGFNTIEIERDFWCSEHTYSMKNGPEVHEAESNRVTVETELEGVFLVGSFRVLYEGPSCPGGGNSHFIPAPFVLAPPETAVPIENLVQEGYPFFAGRITLSHPIVLPPLQDKRVLVAFDGADAHFIRVHVNGSDAGLFMWPPYRMDITPWVLSGENTITFTLWNSNRNLMGPHHHTHGETQVVTHQTYCDPAHRTDDYNVLGLGIPNGVRIVITEGCNE